MHFLDGVVCVLLISGATACAAEGAESPEGAGGCETGDGCADDSDCGAGTRCNRDACTRLNCLPDNSPCDTNEVCKSQACANGPPGDVCLTGPRPAGWACSAMYGCATGTECILGRCTVPNLPEGELCTADEQCATGLFCQTATCVAGATGQCARPASTNAICCEASDCASPYACVNVVLFRIPSAALRLAFGNWTALLRQLRL